MAKKYIFFDAFFKRIYIGGRRGQRPLAAKIQSEINTYRFDVLLCIQRTCMCTGVKNENILSQFPLYKNPIRQVVFYPNNIKFKNKSDNCKNKDTLSARRLSLLL